MSCSAEELPYANSAEGLSGFENFILEIVPDRTVRYGLAAFDSFFSGIGAVMLVCVVNRRENRSVRDNSQSEEFQS